LPGEIGKKEIVNSSELIPLPPQVVPVPLEEDLVILKIVGSNAHRI